MLASNYIFDGDTTTITGTIIDGNQNGSVVTFNSEEDSTTVIRGFTIRNGNRGILCSGASPKIMENIITGNAGSTNGGGIYCNNTSPKIIENVITGNTANDNGAGIYCYSSNAEIIANTITANISHDGAAIYCHNSSPTILKNLMYDNQATYGGAIYSRLNSKPMIIGNTISKDSTDLGGAIYIDAANAVVVNTILWQNEPGPEIQLVADGSITVAYSDIQGGESGVDTSNGTVYWLQGNIDAEPLFEDSENRDFNLQEDSPCVDSGTAFFVLEGDTIVNLPDTAYNGTAPDMGAFELPDSIEIDEHQLFPNKLTLYQNYPNPFNPVTAIRYNTPEREYVTLTIYDVLGRQVRTLVNQVEEPGYKSVRWDSKDDVGRTVSAGIYLYQIKERQLSEVEQAGDFVETRKMILLK